MDSKSTKFQEDMTKCLLACGVLSSVLYVVVVLLAPLGWPEYNAAQMSVSELIGIGAPTRPVVLVFFTIYPLLIYAFGAGVWRAAGEKNALRLAGSMIIAKEVLGLVASYIYPCHLRGVPAEMTDVMHCAVTGVGLLCMITAMAAAAVAIGRKFSIYTAATIAVFIVCGVLAGMDAPRVAANQPTPVLGIVERINIFVYMVWVVVLGRVVGGRRRAEGKQKTGGVI